MRPLLSLCTELSLDVTFHRAFDCTRDPLAALEALISLGVPRVLTSGQRNSAEQGAGCLRTLVECAQGRIGVMAGGGIRTPAIAKKIVQESGVKEIHGSVRRCVGSGMVFKPPTSFCMR
eukprot:TRINITY_DN4925_c0_g1_i2.p1 TRINITY_DN4925_c0_g1~~TRINITY_DN4925_c0_g1_i2.p1  ORF type:complete len:119 (+),score=7.56 TRINITY_DN4925_c0_g1_i2:483-839(+)